MEREEQLKLARQLLESGVLSEESANAIKADFPELAESEDERIRKEIIDIIKRSYEIGGFTLNNKELRDKYIAYLEKQKESLHISETCKENADSFTDEGDRIRKALIAKFEPCKQDEEFCGCGFTYAEILAWLEKQKEQKPTNSEKPKEWSEEDEANFAWFDKFFRSESVVANGRDIPQDKYLWFKSIRPQPKAELTLLDVNIINAAVAFVEQNNHFNCWRGIDKHTVIKALRSLKPHWKPSEEQMDALNSIILYGSFTYVGQVQDLISLKDGLKKLM